ncbi:hypothetical protein [Methylobacterium gnaphalii]|uniref:Uncharacterized protein n=1 Tax=Methylobacterium gnaphalii TaxID=1010610 RepID=A0A512JIB1_9HYPH|nr:hypothetical protein [Methylobacterium gnaphalii]GEP09701.1 hypothetical protein MGN01_15460 [Methylobacterium gnaphalii]GJD67714.1 hypothetical protein MMMDOFMJ_0630 [Methylobacterium gnaphalii]GLS50119.1 hypothetical protein GCM10007885_29710 [Methylobacterium gnaphalii]
MRHPIPHLCAALGLTLLAGHAMAEGPPEFDVRETCRSSGSAQLGPSEKDSQDGCLRSERAAHDELKRRWGEFSTAAKAQCSKQATAGGSPSYVETVTCLELATGTVPAQTGDGSPRPAAPARKESSTLTAEPSARQRTNPIDVLERKP